MIEIKIVASIGLNELPASLKISIAKLIDGPTPENMLNVDIMTAIPNALRLTRFARKL